MKLILMKHYDYSKKKEIDESNQMGNKYNGILNILGIRKEKKRKKERKEKKGKERTKMKESYHQQYSAI